MHKVHVQDTTSTRIEDREPIRTFPFVIRRHLVRVKFGQSVPNVGRRWRDQGVVGLRVELAWRWCRPSNLRRTGVWSGLILLRSWRSRRTSARPRLSGSGRSCRLRGLRVSYIIS